MGPRIARMTRMKNGAMRASSTSATLCLGRCGGSAASGTCAFRRSGPDWRFKLRNEEFSVVFRVIRGLSSLIACPAPRGRAFCASSFGHFHGPMELRLIPHLVTHPAMKRSLLFAGVAIATATVTFAAISKSGTRLTPRRVAEINALSTEPRPAKVTVTISGISKIRMATDKSKASMELIRDLRYPTEFAPPEAPKEALKARAKPAEGGAFPVTPTTPLAFETLNTGWTITLSASAVGSMVELYGTADFVEADLVNAGYGALSGPIYSDDGILITPNKLQMPKSSTTTTRFHLFALPGESYEVTLYRGNKAETHTVTVTPE